MPESQAAVPSGRCLPRPGELVLPPGNGAELGKCAGGEARLGRSPCHRRCLRGSEGAEGWYQGQSLSAARQAFHSPTPALTLAVLLSMAFFFPPPTEAIFLSDSRAGKKSIFCVEVY